MKVNICGIPYEVKEVEENFDKGTSLGQISYAKAEILINKDATKEIKREALCHEMMHGIFLHIGRNDLCEDENLVQSLGNAINQGFRVKEITE